MNMPFIRTQLDPQKREQKRTGDAEDKEKKSDAKSINDGNRRHSLGPDLLWEEIP